MDPIVMGWIGIAVIFILILLGMRIAFATALVGFVGVWALKDMTIAAKMVGFLPHGILAHYSLSVVPLFIIMGYYAYFAGMTQDIFHTSRQWLGHLPGGLAIASVFGCAGFAACTGATVATAAIMGRLVIPEMEKYGYQSKMAAGVVAASGTLSALIPPSIVLVIYGIITEQSIGKLLVAGFVPGVLSAAIYAGSIIIRVKLNPKLCTPQPNVSWKKKLQSLKGTWGIFLIIAVVIGGIYSGLFTPTEAGGVGAFLTFSIALVMRRLTRKRFAESLLETARVTIMVFSIILGVLLFVRFLAMTGLPSHFSEFVIKLPFPPTIVLIIILCLYVFLGMFLDTMGMMMLTLPIVYPAVVGLGFDPIWFGIIIVKMCEICLITPPVGITVYVVHSVAPHIPIEDIYRGNLPFLLMDLLTVAVLIAFPKIVTFLPELMW